MSNSRNCLCADIRNPPIRCISLYGFIKHSSSFSYKDVLLQSPNETRGQNCTFNMNHTLRLLNCASLTVTAQSLVLDSINCVAPSPLPDGHVMEPNVLAGRSTPYCSIVAIKPSANGTLIWYSSLISFFAYLHDPSCRHSNEIK